ncbi:DEBR0S4_02432g1_1 [Brettanomyces bruxellensis]|uniref:DEBR0S4_02432g1_1 n=1 Tax=Dekkera bruxellensis TaxID=5007 RepID=A0A7D9D007_DEKBR|nr:DEBR0S4_02432g1_1 [Brettanomyces bruxellensis]
MPFSLFACGSNGGYQLGVGDSKDRHAAEKVKFKIGPQTTTELSQPIKAMSFGGNHSLALLEDGTLIGSGSNSEGQLFCQKDFKQLPAFVPIESVHNVEIRRIACGWEFSVAENVDGEIIVCGYGPNGELGLGKESRLDTNTCLFGKLPFNTNSKGGIKQLCTSIHSVIVVFNNGDVYGWGNNKRGQLFAHNGDRKLKQVREPHKIEFPGNRRVVAVCMGRDFTVFMTTDKDNELLIPIFRGKDNFNIESGLRKLKIDREHFVWMHATWTSVQIFTRDKHILSIGSNTKCQHFPEMTNSDASIDLAAVGSEHGVCTLINESRSKAYAWGWGEHGNCGRTLENTVTSEKHAKDTFDHLNAIYETQNNEKITRVFAGCATSFVEVERDNRKEK